LNSLKSSKTMPPSSISFLITNGPKSKGKNYNKTNWNREISKTIVHDLQHLIRRLLINHHRNLRITSH
jgi:hypothetical protein